MSDVECSVCFRHCKIKEGGLGFCGARTCKDGKVSCANYGQVTSLALDPIEKKPLQRFYPGSLIVSVGSYGCNLRCPFCQNNEISWADSALRTARAVAHTSLDDEPAGGKETFVQETLLRTDYVTPETLAAYAAAYENLAANGRSFTVGGAAAVRENADLYDVIFDPFT